ncbi:TOM7 family [Pyrenophora seminiperda CCB06]|uniref:TOM7 family n=1 Tax=Pyrenophora seminiperda CCB06 TaxID=1302712 RepID=A0A3M7MF99_9PLEO|nr:TOM7 family [Pyrenophora seminiperda CCB06]
MSLIFGARDAKLIGLIPPKPPARALYADILSFTHHRKSSPLRPQSTQPSHVPSSPSKKLATQKECFSYRKSPKYVSFDKSRHNEQTLTVHQERIARIMDVSRVAIHYGYLPLILYLGYSRSEPKPTFIR